VATEDGLRSNVGWAALDSRGVAALPARWQTYLHHNRTLLCFYVIWGAGKVYHVLENSSISSPQEGCGWVKSRSVSRGRRARKAKAREEGEGVFVAPGVNIGEG
jgi:hypothetical protein